VIGSSDTPEHAAIRRILREELDRVAHELASQGPAYLTVREAAKRYRISYDTVRAMIDEGKLSVVKRLHGRGGREQWMVLKSDAELKLAPGA
jgi:excisionase family DNA binding protein